MESEIVGLVKTYLVTLSLPCALLVGCMDDRHHGGDGDHHGATLPSDAYYVGVPLPYRSVADCLADGKLATACTHEVALCASGAYGVRHGDTILSGRYHLDDHHAVSGSDDDDCDHHDGESAAEPFDFDVEAGQLVVDADGGAALVWEPDYESRWKTSASAVIDCSARPGRR